MTPERYTQVFEVFAAACDEKDEARRAAIVDEACAGDAELRSQVESLFKCHAQDDSFLSSDQSIRSRVLLPGSPVEMLPADRRLGRYLLTRVIAAGGMSVVYEAEQESPRRRVAIKVLKAGWLLPVSKRRFQNESEILARLQHSCIAQIFEAGTGDEPDDRPYFVMELVEGALPITRFAQDRSLALGERLLLFSKVCDAVQYGHQNGVIHRDLKPANLLVDGEGRLKVIDFGIARCTDADVAATMDAGIPHLVGTLQYMSPEQTLGDSKEVDTRSDVYSLGVVLHELLTGRLPYDLTGKGVPESIAVIREHAVKRLGEIDPRLRGDLEIIAAKAMAKDRERRYQSVAELAGDIRRHLNHEPIAARPASLWYSLRRFVRRNRLAAAGFLGFIVVLIGATVLSTMLALSQNRHRKEAQAAEQQTQRLLTDSLALSSLLKPMLGEQGTDVRSVEIRELLLQTERELRLHRFSDSALEATLHETLGAGFLHCRELERAAAHLEEALELRRTASSSGDLPLAECLYQIACLRLTKGRPDQARKPLLEALEIRRALLGRDHFGVKPHDGLEKLISFHLPDEPEALKYHGRRALLHQWSKAPKKALERSDDPREIVVVDDSFDTAELDPKWNVSFDHVEHCDLRVADSRAVVSSMHPPESFKPEDGSMRINLRRDLPAIEDFHLRIELGWDSDGRVEAMQAAGLQGFDASGRKLMTAWYADHWIDWGGARRANIGEQNADRVEATSGTDSLPLAGEAMIEIERKSGLITIWWDGRPFLKARRQEPLQSVVLFFDAPALMDDRGRRSLVGSMFIDHVRIAGIPSAVEQSPPETSYPAESR